MEDGANDAMQGSSSSRHQKCLCNTSGDIQETSELDANRPRETVELFEPFDTPPLSCNVVLDFESCDVDGHPVTTERLLLRKVLEQFKDKDCHTLSASGKRTSATHGMVGVGKTTALRALRYKEDVKNAYRVGM